jgi:hypothetical protein
MSAQIERPKINVTIADASAWVKLIIAALVTFAILSKLRGWW